MNTLTQSWDDIRKRYRGLQNDSHIRINMLALVEHISSSKASIGIFPWTSMFDLYLTQTHCSPFDGAPYLKISPKENNLIEFRYIDTWKSEKQCARIVEARYAIDRFDKFIDQLSWVVKSNEND